MKVIKIYFLMIVFLFTIGLVQQVYSRTATSAVCTVTPCPGRIDFLKKVISEYDENNVLIRRTTIWCDGEVSVTEYDENGQPLSSGEPIGDVPDYGEELFDFNYTQVGTTVTGWTLTGYDDSEEMIYQIEMANDIVQIIYPAPPPKINQNNLTGIDNQDSEEINPRMLNVYPVPSKEQLIVKIDSKYCSFDVSKCNIIIASMDGKIVYQTQGIDFANDNELSINLENLPAGVYGISVSNINNMRYGISTSFTKE